MRIYKDSAGRKRKMLLKYPFCPLYTNSRGLGANKFLGGHSIESRSLGDISWYLVINFVDFADMIFGQLLDFGQVLALRAVEGLVDGNEHFTGLVVPLLVVVSGGVAGLGHQGEHRHHQNPGDGGATR